MRKTAYYVIAVCVAVIILVQFTKKNPISWSDNFLHDNKQPYGTYILHRTLSKCFDPSNIHENLQPLYLFLDTSTSKNNNLILVDNYISLDTNTTKKLFAFVHRGNHVLLSAQDFGYNIADTFAFRTYIFYNSMNEELKNTKMKVWLHNDSEHDVYQVERKTIKQVFESRKVADWESDSLKKDNTNRLAHIDTLGFVSGKVNFIRAKYGNGYFYFHSTPHLFSNYVLAKESTYSYAFKCLSFLPYSNKTIVDLYEKNSKPTFQSPLRFILSNEQLSWAYYLTIFLLLVYVFINAKRLQRIIPILKPFQNTTIEFVKTIGDLYFEKGTNKDIVQKRIKFFDDYVRTKLNIREHSTNEIIELLIKKTALDKAFYLDLYNDIQQAKKGEINNDQLITLFKKLDTFYLKH